MRYVYDNDLHIHSKISLCSGDPLQTNERILEYAKKNNLKTICLTDHFWDEKVKGKNLEKGTEEWYAAQNFEHISKAKPLPQTDGIKFLFGCETECDKNFELGIARKTFDEFDFVIIPTTHFHMKDFTIPNNVETPDDKACFWLKKLNSVLDCDLPFFKIGIAHLTCGLIDSSRENYLKTLDALGEEELEAVFSKAAKLGVGIEINSSDMKFETCEADTVLRPYKIAKRCGCKFYMGSDAHHPKELDEAKEIFERAIDLLDLTENDKFKIKK